MNTISAIIEPHEDGTLHLPLPEAWRHRAIRVKAELEPVDATTIQAVPGEANPLKGFGSLRGKITISPDFDEPLEDFKDYIG
jgi:hypothetical protein